MHDIHELLQCIGVGNCIVIHYPDKVTSLHDRFFYSNGKPSGTAYVFGELNDAVFSVLGEALEKLACAIGGMVVY